MNTLPVMAWRNLGRNRRRTALSGAAIAFATALLIFFQALQLGSYDSMIENTVRINSGHLQIQHPEFREEGSIVLALEDPDKLLKIADNAPGVVAASPRIVTGMLVSKKDQSFGAMLMGIDAAREARVTTIKTLVKEGEYLDPADPQGVIVGKTLAGNLGATIGDELILMGTSYDGSTAAERVHVRGIFKTGLPELDRQSFYANLSAVQQWTWMEGRVHSIAILLDDNRSINKARDAIAAQLPTGEDAPVVLDWKQINPGIDQAIRLDKAFGQVMLFVLVMIVGFGIMNTFLMSALERTREFGVMLAIGVRPRTCAWMLILEGQLLFLVSFLTGTVVGTLVTLYFSRDGITFPGSDAMYESYGMSQTIFPSLTGEVAYMTVGMVWVIVALVSAYPAWRITRLRPVQALRFV
ncbi:MAG: ABC transporter permease [Deltaproteobacteria bacterium]|nr:ABC transporter permease [Deltaproteobacteria bacterium]MCB9478650.1 ABC transporter permease [Deltaproteobacteria bacterium]MCB9489819.1 ABC transporter permease [Deltaproteobacteria bacterium]